MLLACTLLTLPQFARAQTVLADSPVFATLAVPGNVALPLSVEWPTTQRTAHTAAYSTAATFLGYFDPEKCYTYTYDSTDTGVRPSNVANVSYFQPAGMATSHVCSGKWSGNFLNWATTPTIDPFRWALTGGFRLVDTTTKTVLEKAWADTNTGLFPDRSISGTLVTGATPFNWATVNIRIAALGNKMRFTGTGNLGNTPTAYNGSGNSAGTNYEAFVRARVCDSTTVGAGGVEANCVQYGTNWKPEGLMQKYSQKMRFSVFGYLNDSTQTRDGGVLRARQKFVGPMSPVPGSAAITNAAREWDPATGIYVQNPDTADASATNTLFGPSPAVVDSGVMNYVNKFGEISPSASYAFKSYDPVSELFYAAVRYFKNQANVPSYTDMTGATTATKTGWIDGFPVITNWTDPIQYTCQRNFILGIGDIYTWDDKNVPGSGTGSTNEPTKPALVSGDSTVNAVTATNKVFTLEGLSTPNWDNYSGRNNSAGIAGLAYDSHTVDIRPDLAGTQTIDTYWVDVLEQPYVSKNQYWLAAKYGGFTVPAGYSPYGNTTALPTASWNTTGDLVGSDFRPDNYFTGGKPDQLVAGLTAAFDKISAQLTAYTTSFATTLPQVAVTGNASYSSQYDASNWTGEVSASSLVFSATDGTPTLTPAWNFTTTLASQLSATNAWRTNRRIVTWTGTAGAQFCSGTTGCTLPLTAAQVTALTTSYTTNNAANFIAYLRGDQTNEQGSTATGSTKAYRARTKLIGDIVGSKARPVGAPSFPFSDAANPGYAAFKNTWAGRPTVVYVGANDGMMHAIRGDLTGANAGQEMFAYVPAAVFQGPNGTPNVDGLASLGNPSFVHHYMVNATPNVFDVDFGRTPDASGAKRTAAPDWRSILVGGLGKGGRSYYALDVTDPVGMVNGGEAAVASKVLWEFTDTDLGYTYGDPIVAKTAKYGWVVIIPSGFNPTDGRGHLLIINPRTGALLEKVATSIGSPTNSAGLAYANAFVVDATDGTADAVYAGDLLGNIWRWDLTATSGSYPAPLRFATLTDSGGAAQPVTSRPVIEVHPTTKKRFVMVGTGKLLDQVDIANTQQQSFYTFWDGSNARFNSATDLPAGITFPLTRARLVVNSNALTGVTFDPTSQVGWVEDLGNGAGGVGWRVTSDATTLLGSVAWAATLPNGSVCSPSGSSRIYARDFATALTTVKTPLGALTSYVDMAGNVTDLRYYSVNGKARLIAGTDVGGVQKVDITPPNTLTLRRLNWRELQTVD